MKNVFLVLSVLLLFVSCSDDPESVTTDDFEMTDDATNDTTDESTDNTVTDNEVADADEAVVDSDEESDDAELNDEDSESGEFLSGFETAGKECITDIPDGRIILAVTRNYSNSDLPWRINVLILKDDGSIVDTEKFFEVDSALEGIGFNSNGRLAAISSWKTGHVTLFALVNSTLCISEKEIVLPNLKVNGDSTERVIFDEIVADPNDPYKLFLVSSNILKIDDNNNYSGGIYTMTVDKFGKAVISEDHPAMHVPSAFAILPGGKKALVLGGKEFIAGEGSSPGSAGPEDLALLDITGKTAQVIKWFDIWGATGVNSSVPSIKSIGVSDSGQIMISNSSEYSEDPGKIKLFQYDGNETISHVSSFTNAVLDAPCYITLNNEGTTAVILNSLFKGATLGIDEGTMTFVKKETHDLTEPMVKLTGEPFENHVLIHSFRSSNDDSSSITIAEITPDGLNELSSTQIPLKDDYSALNMAVQNF